MALNVNELIIDRVRSIEAYDPTTGELQYRLTQVEEPSLNTSAEGEEVTDAVGAKITTLYRSKQATFSGTNSLFHLGLAAKQFGADAEQGAEGALIKNSKYETFTVVDGQTSVELAETPVEDVKYIYSMVNNGITQSFTAGAAVSATEFTIEGKVITLPTGFTGKLFVQYMYETIDGVRVINRSDEFPEASRLFINVILRDSCNENVVYAGTIIAERAKLSPESVELSFTPSGKHPFEYELFTEYCDSDKNLFELIVSK